ncbi:MAG: putative transcriptional regulator [Flavobacteriales bacterium]|jgi:putative transcriptional regulator|tara:strand:- start:14669 stop:15286 length:618 start_codon:yes stop_codon:yes gene_type:complete
MIKLIFNKNLMNIKHLTYMKTIIKPQLNKGKLLLSQPLISDEFFHNSVVFISEYSDDGIVGFIVNKPLNFEIFDLIDGFPEFDTTIYYGGPVETENLYFIHRVPEKITGSVHITKDLYWGGSFEQVKTLIQNGDLKPDDIRFFLGYSGWGKEQLDQEISSESWLVDETDESLFDWDIEGLWKDRLKIHGKEFQLWDNAPKDIRLN